MAAPRAQDPDSLPTPAELKRMSLEELMDVKVTLVSKTPERLTQVPSAVQVITQDDIRRSGAVTLPDALRLASNLQVAQIDGRQWAISARGMNMGLANKLLVMIDGRTVYTPLYAGVFWDLQNLLVDNIERIEVVSGPGGTLWGANAVNGVINVITKGSEYTQGGLVGLAAGTTVRDVAGARYGGKLGQNAYYRVWGRRFDHNGTDTLGGGDGNSGWDFTQGGLRMDYLPSERDRLTLTGNIATGNFESQDTRTGGQYLIGRWTRQVSEESEVYFQAYADHQDRAVPGIFDEDLQTLDFDFHHRIPLGARNSFIWGAGYRVSRDQITNSAILAILPADKTLQLFNGFIQDQFAVIPEKVDLTLGSKLEHNDYSGWEVMPSARLAWTPTGNQTVWGAISRAVRSPSRVDADFFLPAPPVPAGTPRLLGGPDFMAENLTAYELGYRTRPMVNLSLSVAAFYDLYDDLRILEQVPGTATDYIYANGGAGGIRGVELSAGMQATPWWQVRGGYTWLDEEYWVQHGHAEIPIVGAQGNDPGHQFTLHSNMDLSRGFQLNAAARFVSELTAPKVPNYGTFDLGAVWEYRNLTVSVLGQNLAERRHREFAVAPDIQEIPRSVLGRISCRF
ncbi:MAG: TonB-dependent receptor [Fibrobacteres bacterium]|nr:TonB-dependent receptor [Fibrobacterota bacterium]